MCIIIDTNKMGKFLNKSSESEPIHKWLDKRLGKIALAKASKTRLLYTGDGDLIKDFKNRRFIDKGKIYSRQENKHLLTGKICQR